MPHMTVADNVATVPRLLGWDKPRIAGRGRRAARAGRPAPADYRSRTRPSCRAASGSGSGWPRALAADPPVMLMDEPFGAVDPIVRDRLQNELLRLQEALAKTILFVTHDIDEAIKMGDLVAVMQVGGLLQFGRRRRSWPGRRRRSSPTSSDGPRAQAPVARTGRRAAVAAGDHRAARRPAGPRGRASSSTPSRTCCSSTSTTGHWAGSTSTRCRPRGPAAATCPESAAARRGGPR